MKKIKNDGPSAEILSQAKDILNDKITGIVYSCKN